MLCVDESFAVWNRVRGAPQPLRATSMHLGIHHHDVAMYACTRPLHHTGAVHSARSLTCGRRPHSISSTLYPTCTTPVESCGDASTTFHSRRSPPPRCCWQTSQRAAALPSPPCTPATTHAHLPTRARVTQLSPNSRAPTGSRTCLRNAPLWSSTAVSTPSWLLATASCRLVIPDQTTAPCRQLASPVGRLTNPPAAAALDRHTTPQVHTTCTRYVALVAG